MCYVSLLKLNMLESTVCIVLDTNINFTIIAKPMLLLYALVTFYDKPNLIIFTYTGVETFSLQHRVIKDNQALNVYQETARLQC